MNSIIILFVVTNSFFSADKILHFSYSAGLTGLSNHIMSEQFGLDRGESRYFSISLTTTIGLSKEIFDAKRGKKFDFKDIIWDLAGIGVGYLLFVR